MNIFKDKTAVCIITCNREDMFKKAYESIDKDAVGKIFVVNAGDRYTSYPEDAEVVLCLRSPTPVGQAKNKGLRAMHDMGYEYLFLMEDDVTIKNNKVFEEYILTAADSGLWAAQLSYGLHGGVAGGNLSPEGNPIKRATVKYTTKQVDFYRNAFQAFTLIHANVLKFGAWYAEDFINAGEHLFQHCQMFKRKLGTPFWHFGDIYNSHEYIEDQDVNHERSEIRRQPDFMKNFSHSWQLLKHKLGVMPNEIADTGQEALMSILENIEKHYAQKQLLI